MIYILLFLISFAIGYTLILLGPRHSVLAMAK